MMNLNDTTYKYLAEAIKHATQQINKTSFAIKNISSIVEEARLQKALSIAYLNTSQTIDNSKNAKNLIVITDDVKNYVNKKNVCMVVVVNKNDSQSRKVIKKYRFQIDKDKKNRLAFSEYVGKPEISKTSLLKSFVSTLIISGRYTSKIHVNILDLTKPYDGKYKSKASFTNRLIRLIYKIKKVIKFQVNKALAPLSTKWPIKIFYKIYFEKYLSKTITPLLPEGEGSKRSLAICINWLDSGGVERVTLNLIKDLKKHGFDIHLMTTVPGDNPWDTFFKEECTSVTHLHEILKNHSNTDAAKQFVLVQWLKKINAKTLMITNSLVAYKSLPGINKRVKKIKVFDVLHTHGTPKEKDAYLNLSMPYIKYIDKRVVIDKYLKDYYIKNYPIDPKSVNIIYNGLDETVKKTDIKIKKSSSKDNKVHIVYMGRLDKDKSPIRLVEIARYLKNGGMTAVLDVYGEGSEKSIMINLARKYKLSDENIIFHGRSDRALEDIARADFSILVSNSEGIPMSILESMHVGTPCIAPAVGGIPEMITDNKEGILFHYKSDSEDDRLKVICEGVERAIVLFQNKVGMAKLTNNAQNQVSSKFGHMTEEYIKLIDSLHKKD